MVENKECPKILPGSEVHRRSKRESLRLKDRSTRKWSAQGKLELCQGEDVERATRDVLGGGKLPIHSGAGFSEDTVAGKGAVGMGAGGLGQGAARGEPE